MSIYGICRRIRHAKVRRAVVWPGFWDEACAFRRAHEIAPGGRDLRTQRNEREGLREDEHLWELRGVIASYRPPPAPPYEGGDVARRPARDEHL